MVELVKLAMRLLKQVGIFFLLPFLVLIDAHIGQLVESFYPHFHLASHFCFYFSCLRQLRYQNTSI